ncbi:hypothetical protein P7C73_g301, partial [Tremellales sp. Uapishka_1]
MSFLPIGPCCVKGHELIGTPRGIIEPISPTRTVGRYHTKPSNGEIVDDKTALVIFYDAFGFNLPNSKILADTYADKLGLNVYVVDYIPSPLPHKVVDGVVPSYPQEHAQKSYFTRFKDFLGMLWIIPYIPGVMNGRILPLVKQGVDEIKHEGYERIGAVGYCRGGSMIIHLLSTGDASPLECGVICHPGPESKAVFGGITKPTLWACASEDSFFNEKLREDIRQTLGGKQADGVEFHMEVYPETTHGFAARPNFDHEPTKKAFEQVGEESVAFLKKHLIG